MPQEPTDARRDPPAKSPFVFVVGCPRSGTTLLQRMLDHHPRLAVANDTHFVVRCLQKHAPEHLPAARRGVAPPVTEALLAGLRSYHRFRRLGVDVEEGRDYADYGELVADLYDRFAARREKPLGGEKTPDFVRELDLLAALFPAAKMVHIHRDGRDVALSVREWANERKGPGKLELWRTHPLAVCALWWRWQTGRGRRSGERLGERRYHEVRYDNLVARPETTLRELSAFLGLDFSAEMLAYHEGKRRDDPRLSAKSAWLPPVRGLRDWRTQMEEDEVALFELLAGDLLVELGYELSGAVPSSAARRAADEAKAWWDARRGAESRTRST